MTIPIALNFADFFNQPVASDPMQGQILIGQQRLGRGVVLDFGERIGLISTGEIDRTVTHFTTRTNGTCRPQLAAVLYRLTRKPFLMHTYFPLTKILSEAEHEDFDQLVQSIIPRLDLRLYDDFKHDVTHFIAPDTQYIVAGHLAELYFYRRDILEQVLAARPRIWLYTTPNAFKLAGGVAGGNYSHSIRGIQLVLSRIYEGFYGQAPGAAPFLHEFGHLLDFFGEGDDVGIGLPPGLRRGDPLTYTAQAHEHFREGKQVELNHYMRCCEGQWQNGDPIPVGHPYVFQNDSEFLAGYLEMFFRNPHYFAATNPDLYRGFAELFRQDPRRVWEADFPYYVKTNRDTYTSGKRPNRPRLSIR
jgi:hypothetical protein